MKIAVTSKSFSKNKVLVDKLKAAFPEAEIKLQLTPKGLTPKELILFLCDCDRAIIALEEINSDILKHCPKLKVISKFGVGLNNINQADCKKFGVKVGWTGGVNKLSVAEMTIGFMLGLSRKLFTGAFNLKEGDWLKDGGFQLTGKTIGIIGIGHIGKEVIRLLTPFNCRILVNDILGQEEYYKMAKVTHTSKDQIFKEAHIITVHTPLTNETNNMFNLESLKKCENTPYLINTARGGIINETELVEAIHQGLILGAAIDPFISEPLDIEEIYQHKSIITTPHIGGNAKEAVLAMGESAIQNLH